MKTLDELRHDLNAVDEQILQLLEQRFRLTDEVAVVKNASGAPLTDKAREAELISRLKQSASHPALREYIEDIYTQIMSLNKKARIFNQHDTLSIRSVGIIGLGVIGGSIAKALKSRYHHVQIATIKRDSKDNTYGTAHGYLDCEYETIAELVQSVDCIILATPIETIQDYAHQIADSAQALHKDKPLIVIDTGSTKQNIAPVFEALTTNRVQFIPTHPMAGSEKMGFEHAKAMLFVQKPWVITPHTACTDESVGRVRELVQYLGSHVEECTPEEHDMLVASVSHLVFMLSTYLFAFCKDHHEDAVRVAGTGFYTTTRLASGNALMHSQIYNNNKTNIDALINDFVAYLKKQQLDSLNSQAFFESNKTKRDLLIVDTEE